MACSFGAMMLLYWVKLESNFVGAEQLLGRQRSRRRRKNCENTVSLRRDWHICQVHFGKMKCSSAENDGRERIKEVSTTGNWSRIDATSGFDCEIIDWHLEWSRIGYDGDEALLPSLLLCQSQPVHTYSVVYIISTWSSNCFIDVQTWGLEFFWQIVKSTMNVLIRRVGICETISHPAPFGHPYCSL